MDKVAGLGGQRWTLASDRVLGEAMVCHLREKAALAAGLAQSLAENQSLALSLRVSTASLYNRLTSLSSKNYTEHSIQPMPAPAEPSPPPQKKAGLELYTQAIKSAIESAKIDKEGTQTTAGSVASHGTLALFGNVRLPALYGTKAFLEDQFLGLL
jgi:hypothetical protein